MLRSCWIVLLLSTLPCVASSAPSTPDLLNRLNTAAELSTLSDPTLKPWHLKMDFDLLDPKGAVREHGTLEEWWAAPDRFRIAVTSPSYTAVETRDGDKAFRTRGQSRRPDLEDLLVSQISAPLQKTSELKSLTAFYEKKTLGTVDLDCIMPSPPDDPRMRTYLGQYTTYCFDPGQSDLRLLIRYRDQLIVRNRLARFQNRSVSPDLSVLDAGHVVLISHIALLSTYTPDVHDFEPTPEQQAILVTPRVGSAVVAGMLLTKANPTYPRMALAHKVSGVVILHATIGKDGHIKDLSAIRSPDQLLTESAVDAVRRWTYRPYLVDGQPTEVETTITVNFNIG